MVTNRLIKKSKPDPSSGPTQSRTRSNPVLVGLESPKTPANSAANLITPGADAILRSLQDGQEHGNERLVSNTMKLALSGTTALTRSSSPEIHSSSVNLKISGSPNPFVRYTDHSRREQYWAARALTAETLLAAKKEHYEDVKNVTFAYETKRVNEVALLTKSHDERLVKLEKALVVLLGILILFTSSIFLSHLLLAHAGAGHKKDSWAHFTIPILSPFASVVEHESSVIGSRTIISICLIVAGLAYVFFRYHWIGRNQLHSR